MLPSGVPASWRRCCVVRWLGSSGQQAVDSWTPLDNRKRRPQETSAAHGPGVGAVQFGDSVPLGGGRGIAQLLWPTGSGRRRRSPRETSAARVNEPGTPAISSRRKSEKSPGNAGSRRMVL
jgi:hypothetical protein